MAKAIQVTISTASKAGHGDQSREVSIALTYALDGGDADVARVVEEKSAEVARAHRKAWRRIRETSDEQSRAPGDAGASALEEGAPESPPSTPAQQNAIRRLLNRAGLSDEEVSKAARVRFASDGIGSLNNAQASRVLLALQRHGRELAQAAQTS